MRLRVWAFAATVVLDVSGCGQSEVRQSEVPDDDSISIHHAVVVQPVMDDVAAIYLTIVNDGAFDDTLMSIASSWAGKVDIHQQMSVGAMVEMRPVDQVIVPAGEQVALEPGGMHVMLQELIEPLVVGDTVVVEFRFAGRGTTVHRIPVVTYGDLP